MGFNMQLKWVLPKKRFLPTKWGALPTKWGALPTKWGALPTKWGAFRTWSSCSTTPEITEPDEPILTTTSVIVCVRLVFLMYILMHYSFYSFDY